MTELKYTDIYELGSFKLVRADYPTHYYDGDEIPELERIKPELGIEIEDCHYSCECEILRDDAIKLVEILSGFIEETKPIR